MCLAFFFFGLCSQSILHFRFVPLFLKQNKEQYQEQLIDEMVELIPTVMKKLQKEKLVVDFCQLLRLINEEKLPLQNIALHLLFNVVGIL
jgi:hypothetical protein